MWSRCCRRPGCPGRCCTPPGSRACSPRPARVRPLGRKRIDQALGRLASASLLTFSVDGASVAAHRLTMRVATERQARDGTLAGLGAGIAELLEAVTGALPEPWQNRPAARDAIAQIMALHEHLAPYLGGHDAALTGTLLRLRGWAIWCLDELGDSFTQAIQYGQDLLADSERVLGETHPDTLTSRSNLAGAYQAAGRLAEAIPLLERTLADRERVLGETHPDTLTLPQQPRFRLQGCRAAGRGHPAAGADPRRLRAGPGRDPPRHPDLPEQPRSRLSGGRAAGRGHPAVRADPRRPRAGSRRDPPRHPDLPQQPRCRLPGGRAAGRGHPAV